MTPYETTYCVDEAEQSGKIKQYKSTKLAKPSKAIKPAESPSNDVACGPAALRDKRWSSGNSAWFHGRQQRHGRTTNRRWSNGRSCVPEHTIIFWFFLPSSSATIVESARSCLLTTELSPVCEPVRIYETHQSASPPQYPTD